MMLENHINPESSGLEEFQVTALLRKLDWPDISVRSPLLIN
jgi:hypothetical protein